MPIYEYRCETCGYQNEYLQKISEPPLSICPSCGKESFRKQLTAAGFQLKGSGWYATDFRNKGTKPPANDAKPASGDKPAATGGDGASTSGSGSEPAAATKATTGTTGAG